MLPIEHRDRIRADVAVIDVNRERYRTASAVKTKGAIAIGLGGLFVVGAVLDPDGIYATIGLVGIGVALIVLAVGTIVFLTKKKEADRALSEAGESSQRLQRFGLVYSIMSSPGQVRLAGSGQTVDVNDPKSFGSR